MRLCLFKICLYISALMLTNIIGSKLMSAGHSAVMQHNVNVRIRFQFKALIISCTKSGLPEYKKR